MTALTAQWVEWAGRGWPVLLALMLQVAAFRLLKATNARFEKVTEGYPVFDLQNRLTTAQVHTQLAAYGGTSKLLYRRFFVIDFFFPLCASLFLSLLWALLLPRLGADFLLAWQAPLWAFLPAVFDWGENLCFLLLIERHPRTSPWLAMGGVAAKRLKLVTLVGVLSATVLLVLGFGLQQVL